jgi:hypothetical protein
MMGKRLFLMWLRSARLMPATQFWSVPTKGGWSATIRYVPYDNAAMVALARSKGMLTWASAIATGWVERDR